MGTSIANLIFLVFFVGFFTYFLTRQPSIDAPKQEPEPLPAIDQVPVHESLDQVPEQVEIIDA